MRWVLMPVAVAASVDPPVASTWVPNRVRNKDVGHTAMTAAMMNEPAEDPDPAGGQLEQRRR